MRVARLAVFALVTMPVINRMAAGDPEPYRIHARMDPVERRLEGVCTIPVSNRSDSPDDEVLLVTYPNRFADPDPDLDDHLFSRVFPDGVSPGAMRIQAVSASGRPCRYAFESSGNRFARITLPFPLPPGEETALTVSYVVDIPRRYGSFGAVNGGICLNGGWYPYLAARGDDGAWRTDAPPAVARFSVAMECTRPGHVFVNRRHLVFDGTGTGGQGVLDECARYLTLLYYPSIHRTVSHEGPVRMEVVTRSARRPASERLMTVLRQAVAFARADFPDAAGGPSPLLLLEAPLRRDLALPGGGGGVLVSDRFGQVFAPARDYHLAPVIEAVFQVLLQAQLPLSDPSVFPWEVEALAWLETVRFWKIHGRRDRSARRYLKPFGFIPEVDRWIHAPHFPFTGAIFGDVHADDPLREDIMRHNRRTAHGRILAEKLAALLGESALDVVRVEALKGERPFLELAQDAYGKPLAPVLSRWTYPYPDVNYRLAGWTQSRQPSGQWRVRAALERSDPSRYEPVMVEARPRFGPGVRAYWRDPAAAGILILDAPRKIRRVRIDPDYRLRETDRADNRLPPGFRILLNHLKVSLDLNGREHEVRVGGSVIAGNGYRNRYKFYVFANQEQNGIELKHEHAFGRRFDAVEYGHEGSWGVTYADLDPEFADAASGWSNAVGRVAALTLRYAMRTSGSSPNRLDGWRFEAAGEFGDKLAGGDVRYWKLKLGMNHVMPLRRDRHLLAIRASFGATAPEKTPAQLLYDIGGYDAVRGINRGQILGNCRWQASAEYRWVVWNDLDAHLLTLAWLRRVQLAAYLDAGNVGETADALFRDSRVFWGAGMGVRLHVDALGAFPGVWRFDVARPLDRSSPSGRHETMYYLGVGQSF